MALFGTGFEGGSAALVVLAIGVLFQFGTGPVTVTLIVVGRPNLALLDYLVVVVVEFTLGLLLIPSLGVLGAAVATAAGTVLNNVLPLAQVWRILRITPYRTDFWKPVVAGGAAWIVAEVAVAAIDPAKVVEGVIAISMTAITYLAVVLLLRLNEQDRAMLDAIVRRTPRPVRSSPRGSDDRHRV
jgi:O-antigen/teichoic acid export membrane protein